jgi:hypothetical protein
MNKKLPELTNREQILISCIERLMPHVQEHKNNMLDFDDTNFADYVQKDMDFVAKHLEQFSRLSYLKTQL